MPEREACPSCGSDRVLRHVYGLVTPAAMDSAGPDVRFEGCVVGATAPLRSCDACGHEWMLFGEVSPGLAPGSPGGPRRARPPREDGRPWEEGDEAPPRALSPVAQHFAGAPDMATLFGPESPANQDEEWTLTPRTALRLWDAAILVHRRAVEDIENFGDTPVDPDGVGQYGCTWSVFTWYPRLTWGQGALWRQFAAQAYLDIADVLAAGERPYPVSPAEEMALSLVLDEAETRAQDDDDLNEAVQALGAEPGDDSWEDCHEFLFEDDDLLLLFNPLTEAFGDPRSALHQTMPDIADYRPHVWFDPFNTPPRRPDAETYAQARRRLGLDRDGRPRAPRSLARVLRRRGFPRVRRASRATTPTLGPTGAPEDGPR